MIKIQAIGHIGKDAVLKDVNGKKVINFSIAHTEKFKNAQDTVTEKTTWIECSMWERENLAAHLKKGTMVYIEGTPSASAYVSTDGELKASLRCRVFSLQLLGGKKENGANDTGSNVPQTGTADDLPF
jgi:single-strand DNA-binding protein